ncbi:MAG TPA: cytochrome c [Cytophagaceae bacterium]|nr:cytochrome c [Cytophagaceae bacterium]
MKLTITHFAIIIGLSGLVITKGYAQTVSPGKKVYDNNCLTCHQADGSGVPGMNPPLSNVSWVTGDKQKLIQIVLNGLTTPLEIDDEVYHNPMPAHKHLTDREVADVLTYIRSSFGNKASAVTVEEVKKVRGIKK